MKGKFGKSTFSGEKALQPRSVHHSEGQRTSTQVLWRPGFEMLSHQAIWPGAATRCVMLQSKVAFSETSLGPEKLPQLDHLVLNTPNCVPVMPWACIESLPCLKPQHYKQKNRNEPIQTERRLRGSKHFPLSITNRGSQKTRRNVQRFWPEKFRRLERFIIRTCIGDGTDRHGDFGQQ